MMHDRVAFCVDCGEYSAPGRSCECGGKVVRGTWSDCEFLRDCLARALTLLIVRRLSFEAAVALVREEDPKRGECWREILERPDV